MAASLLLDASGIVSLLDRSQARHVDCVRQVEAWGGAIVTTESVLTESTHLLARVPDGGPTCLDFIVRGGSALVPTSRTTLLRAAQLMRKYADIPMDFADATLVVLAEELNTDLVLTLDRRGFETFRIGGRRPFCIVP